MPERGKSGFATVSGTYIRRVRRLGKRRVAGASRVQAGFRPAV